MFPFFIGRKLILDRVSHLHKKNVSFSIGRRKLILDMVSQLHTTTLSSKGKSHGLEVGSGVKRFL